MLSAMRLKHTRGVAALGAGAALALAFLMSTAFGHLSSAFAAPAEHQGLRISAVGVAAAQGTPELPPAEDDDEDGDDEDSDDEDSDDEDSDDEAGDEGVSSASELPDSGGPSRVWLWSGVALVTAGAGVVRISRLRAQLAGRPVQR
jgi:hypothetical protein